MGLKGPFEGKGAAFYPSIGCRPDLGTVFVPFIQILWGDNLVMDFWRLVLSN